VLTPKVTSGKKLSQCRERGFKQKRFQFTIENVKSPLFHELHMYRLFRALGLAWEKQRSPL